MELFNNPTIGEVLEKLGLNKNEANIYEYLLNIGSSRLKPILGATKLKKGNAYYHLDSLKEKGLVETKEERGRTIFSAKHPEHLGLLLAKQKTAVFSAEEDLNKYLPQFRKLYQMVATKPTVKYFDGLEGAKEVVKDSLTSTTEICSYIDSEALNKKFPELNKEFTNARLSKGVKKKIITVDSPFIRQHAKSFTSAKTLIRVIPTQTGFSTIMYIYDNKVSYISIVGENISSVIIEHKSIFNMHKVLFESLWQTAKAL